MKTADGNASDDAGEGGRLQPAKGRTLEDYLAACAVVIDEATVEWALGLPALPGLGGDDALDRRGGVLTDETDDEAADAGSDDGQAPPPDFNEVARNASETRRHQFRKFCEGVLDRAAAWPNLMRALSARLVLNAVAADLWLDESERGEVLRRLMVALVASGDEPTDEERAALASYTAVALALLRADVRRLSVNDEATLRFKSAAEASRPILTDVDLALLDIFAAEFRNAFGVTTTGERILDLAMEVQRPLSGVAAAIVLLRDEDGVTASEENGALLIHDPLPAVPERELVRFAGLVEGSSPVVVRGHMRSGNQIFCVWQAPLLLIARRTRAGSGGRLYDLGGSNPRVIAAGWEPGFDVGDNFPKPIADWFPGRQPPNEALELLALADGGS